MRGSVLISLFGVSMAMAGSIVACGGEEEKAATAPTGAEGESCTRRADCSSGLKCFDNVCVKSASPGSGGTGGSGAEAGGPGTGGTGGSTGGSGGKGGSTGGTGGKGGSTGGSGPAPDLGGEGESCTRSADCEAGLGCYNNRCAEEPTGDAGDGNTPGVNLGGQGETCVLSSDCETGLICVPADTGGTGAAAVGVCSPADTGIEPTGKSCFAECMTPDDCCELPTELHATLGVKSCTELALLIANAGGCASPDTVSSPLCFAQDAYCDCASGTATWQCTAGQCVYNAPCEVDGLVVNGCATFSRSGRALTATCDAGGTDRCRLPAGQAFCDTDADCEMVAVSDDPTDTCIANECVCHQKSQCLRKCAEDLDCAFGKVCEDDVCVPAGTCSSNVTCQVLMGDYRATCVEGACTMPCDQDIDCNAGLTDGSLSMVCDAGSCKAIGCTNHDECQNATDVANQVANPRKMFCVTVPEGGGTVTASSAITD